MLMGWVKLHREILEKAIWKCSTTEQKIVLITILLLANHKSNQWIWKGKKFKCEPGQFVTSLKSLANYGNVSVKNVRTALLKFEKLEFLTNDTATDGRLITICNWDRYQGEHIDTGKQTGKAPAKNGQNTGKGTATNNNDKKDKKDNNEEFKTWQDLVDYARKEYKINFNKEKWTFEIPQYPTNRQEAREHHKKWKPIVTELNQILDKL